MSDKDTKTYAERMAEKYSEGGGHPSNFDIEIVNFGNISNPSIAKLEEPVKITVGDQVKRAVNEAAESIEREAREQWPTVGPSWMERVRRMVRGENDN